VECAISRAAILDESAVRDGPSDAAANACISPVVGDGEINPQTLSDGSDQSAFQCVLQLKIRLPAKRGNVWFEALAGSPQLHPKK
jgi:hypothetical protein